MLVLCALDPPRAELGDAQSPGIHGGERLTHAKPAAKNVAPEGEPACNRSCSPTLPAAIRDVSATAALLAGKQPLSAALARASRSSACGRASRCTPSLARRVFLGSRTAERAAQARERARTEFRRSVQEDRALSGGRGGSRSANWRRHRAVPGGRPLCMATPRRSNARASSRPARGGGGRVSERGPGRRTTRPHGDSEPPRARLDARAVERGG